MALLWMSLGLAIITATTKMSRCALLRSHPGRSRVVFSRLSAVRPLPHGARRWVSWDDWLHGQRGDDEQGPPFAEARAAAHSIQLRSQANWQAWYVLRHTAPLLTAPPPVAPHPSQCSPAITCRHPGGFHIICLTPGHHPPISLLLAVHRCAVQPYPCPMPSRPDLVYAQQWVSWEDWLGFTPQQRAPWLAPSRVPQLAAEEMAAAERPRTRRRRAPQLTLSEAREVVRLLGLRSSYEWVQLCRDGRRPPGALFAVRLSVRSECL